MSENFNKKVWEACRKIPKGKVSTYKQIAKRIGSKAYRAVGNALNKNPYGILECKTKNMVPCHRVVASNGNLHGFAHGLKKKAMLLKKEGIKIRRSRIKNFEDVLFRF